MPKQWKYTKKRNEKKALNVSRLSKAKSANKAQSIMAKNVREVMRILRRDGWYIDRTRGSHRMYKHPEKKGTVVVAGHPSEDMAEGTWRNVLRQAELH